MHQPATLLSLDELESPVRPRRTPLAGRVALVTGSGHGIGRRIAVHLAELGATVLVNSQHFRAHGEDTAREIEARGGAAEFLWGCVSDPDQLDAIFGHIQARHGRLDILVCAAPEGFVAPSASQLPGHWEQAVQDRVEVTRACALRAAELMPAGSSILTLSSLTAGAPLRDRGVQGVVTAAVESVTRQLAEQLAPAGIRVNGVSVGAVYGPLLAEPDAREDQLVRWCQLASAGELCCPDDVAAVVELLVSDSAHRVRGIVWRVEPAGSAPRETARVPRLPPPRPRRSTPLGA